MNARELCKVCGAPVPNTEEFDAHDHNECESCSDFCWAQVGGDHWSLSSMPEEIAICGLVFCVELTEDQLLRLEALDHADVERALLGDEGMAGDLNYGSHFGPAVYFDVAMENDNDVASAVATAKRVRAKLHKLLEEAKS